jgi:hypothetical protein
MGGGADRFYGGIDLFKAVKAQKLVFSGGKMPWDIIKKTVGAVFNEYANSELYRK